MDSQDIRNLQEAYLEVYQQLNEAKVEKDLSPSKIVPFREDFDFYDIILSHLLDEGYAETPEAAEVMMVNMSEEWFNVILDEGFKRMNREKIERQAKRLGGDRELILRALADKLDTPVERKFSTRAARLNRMGSGEYRKRQHLAARDDSKRDIEKYGL